MGKYKYHINNLDCANCAREIEEMLNKNENFNNASVNFNTCKVSFESKKHYRLEELNELIKNPEIQNAFIGTSFDLKGDRSTWDKRYLNYLVNASVAEAFNKQYLYHLFEVADYLKKDNNHSGATISKKSWALIAAVIVVLVVASIICFLVKSRN